MFVLAVCKSRFVGGEGSRTEVRRAWLVEARRDEPHAAHQGVRDKYREKAKEAREHTISRR